MATSKDIFLEQQSALVDALSKETLTDNSNRTYGSVLNQDELGVLAILSSPELNTMAQRMMSPDVYNQYVSSFDPKTRLSRYNLPPIDYSDPVFEKARETYKADQERMRAVKEELGPTREAMLAGTAGMPVPERIEPFKFGYENAKTIASLGIDPEKELDTENIVKFRNAIAFGAPRNVTPKDLNYAKENLGLGPLARKNPDIRSNFSKELPGDFAYIDPSRPELGIAYFEEGKEPVMFDSPLVGGMDVAEFALQEGPVVAAEVFIGAKGLNKFDDFLKAVPRSEVTKVNRIMDSVAGNVLLSGGAATTNLLQRFIGLAYGAHDRGLLDLVTESGWLFLLAYAGNQTVDAFLNGVPKLYRIARGKDIEAAELTEIRAAIKRIRESKEGVKVKGVGGREEAVSLLDIDEAITQLSSEIGEKIPAYNPTMAQASKDSRIADIERLLIESGANPQYKNFYDELMAGNEETIQRFFNALYGNLDAGVTAQTVGKEITNLFGRQRGDFVAEGEAIISRLRGSLDDFKKAGDKGLLDEVVDKKASSNLYTRFTSRINNLSREYKEQLGNDIDEALKDERLQGLFSGRLFRKSLLNFKNASKGDGLMNVGGKEASVEFRKFFNEEAQERLLRYSEGDLTLPEINNLRMDLNAYASSIDPGKDAASTKIFNLARDLQNDIEDQMIQQVRKILPRNEADELVDLFMAQKYGMELANNIVTRDLGRQQPESVINYLFSTNTPRAGRNTKVRNFMNFLEESGAQPEINTLRNETIDYIKRNYLDVEGTSSLKLASDYRKFLRNNRGTLRELFPEEQFGKIFDSPQSFNKNVIEPLTGLENKINLMERAFGESNPFNIVTKILGTGQTKKASGELVDDLNLLDEILKTATDKERKILQQQLGDATKKYLITFSTTDGFFDVRKLSRIMDEGFGPEDLVGADLSFAGVYKRLLGDDADAFLKNLNVLRDMGLRQTTDLTTSSLTRRELEQQITDPGINYLKRFFIPPLTQFGRRVTAFEKLIGERNLSFVGNILKDEKLFNDYVAAITGRKKLNNFARTLISTGIPMYVDVGNTLKDYDKNRKEFVEEDIPFYSPRTVGDLVPGILGTNQGAP